MAVRIRLDNDTGRNDGVTSDPSVIGRGVDAGSTVFVRIRDIESGTVTRIAVQADADGKFTYLPPGLDDGAYRIRVLDSDGNRDSVRVKVDTDADKDAPVTVHFGTPIAGGAGPIVSYNVAGLDADARAKVTFTDADGDTVTRFVTANGDYTVNLGPTINGPVTTTFDIIDAAKNTTSVTDTGLVICFFPGTRIATPAGEVAVETLRSGDLVVTTDGDAQPIVWVGRQTVSRVFADPSRVLPIRIVAGALGEDLPVRDLLVSPDHALLIDGVLVHAAALINGSTIRREADVPTVFTYFHIELADHALILAEGVPAETFIDNAGRLAFDNWHEHVAARPEGASVAELPLPRAKSQRQVPAAARARIAERAVALLGKVTFAA